MKTIGKILIAVGLIAIYGAAGSDAAYGPEYPMSELLLTVMAGLALAGAGAAMLKIERRAK